MIMQDQMIGRAHYLKFELVHTLFDDHPLHEILREPFMSLASHSELVRQ